MRTILNHVAMFKIQNLTTRRTFRLLLQCLSSSICWTGRGCCRRLSEMETVRYANLFYFKLWLNQFQACPSPPWMFFGHLASRWSPLLAKLCARVGHLFVYSTTENFLSVLCKNAFLFNFILERLRFVFTANIIFLFTFPPTTVKPLLRPICTVRFLLMIVACDFYSVRCSRHGKIVYDFHDIKLPVATIVIGF